MPDLTNRKKAPRFRAILLTSEFLFQYVRHSSAETSVSSVQLVPAVALWGGNAQEEVRVDTLTPAPWELAVETLEAE